MDDTEKEKLSKKFKKKNSELNILNVEVDELKRQIDLEKDNSMLLINLDGKTSWRSGKVDVSAFVDTFKYALNSTSDKGKDKNISYKIMFNTLESIDKNADYDLLLLFLKEMKSQVLLYKEDMITKTKEEISKIARDLEN